MTSSSRRNITCTVDEGVAHVWLDRPDKLNGLTLEMLTELVATSRRLAKDRTLRAVVLTGAGESFSAGLDVAATMRNPARVARSFVPSLLRGTNLFQEAAWGWRRLPVPVVAAVSGHCYGAGLQLALAADFRISTPTPSGRCSRPAGDWSRTCPACRAWRSSSGSTPRSCSR